MAVAYVLVVQGVLGAIALAAMPAGSSGPLCRGSVTAGIMADDSESGAPAELHCQACLARADQPALPSPPFPVAIDRIAIELKFDVIVREALRVFEARHPFQPRGPPAVRAA